MSESTEATGSKGRRRQAARAAGRQAGGKVKCTIHLTLEGSQRLDIHATMMGLDRSALVEKLVNDHCRRWVVSDRGKSDTDPGDDAAA